MYYWKQAQRYLTKIESIIDASCEYRWCDANEAYALASYHTKCVSRCHFWTKAKAENFIHDHPEISWTHCDLTHH